MAEGNTTLGALKNSAVINRTWPVNARYLRLVFLADVKGSEISLIEWTVI